MRNSKAILRKRETRLVPQVSGAYNFLKAPCPDPGRAWVVSTSTPPSSQLAPHFYTRWVFAGFRRASAAADGERLDTQRCFAWPNEHAVVLAGILHVEDNGVAIVSAERHADIVDRAVCTIRQSSKTGRVMADRKTTSAQMILASPRCGPKSGGCFRWSKGTVGVGTLFRPCCRCDHPESQPR